MYLIQEDYSHLADSASHLYEMPYKTYINTLTSGYRLIEEHQLEYINECEYWKELHGGVIILKLLLLGYD